MADVDMWTNLVTPVELTGYARARLEDYERQQNGSLARWLPNETIPDIFARFEVGQTGLQPVAEFVSYDAEAPLGSLPGTQRVTIELPKLSRKLRVSEYEQLRARGNLSDVLLRTSVERAAESLVDAASDRMEYERGYALEHAKLAIDDETGFKLSGDWARSADHEVSADDNGGAFWDDLDSSDPLSNFLTWKRQYIASNGFPPGAILTSDEGFTTLQRNESLRNLFSSSVGAPSILRREEVNSVLASHGLPPVTVYDRQVNLRGTVTRVLSPQYLFFLPSPGGTIGGVSLGKTYWGRTLESMEAEYGIAELDRPGIVFGTWKTRDPIAVWTHMAAIGLAALGDANLTLRAQILPEGS